MFFHNFISFKTLRIISFLPQMFKLYIEHFWTKKKILVFLKWKWHKNTKIFIYIEFFKVACLQYRESRGKLATLLLEKKYFINSNCTSFSRISPM